MSRVRSAVLDVRLPLLTQLREVNRLEWAKPAWPYVLVAAVLGAVVWPVWVASDRLEIGGDAVLIHYPWFVLWRDALAAGSLPMWNPYTLGGLPALPTLQSGYGYPVHWLLSWLSAIRAMNVSVGLHVVLAGLGAAWCASRLRASPEGQVLAGVSYALGSAMTARLWAGHFSFLEANAWLPVVTGCVLSMRSGRDIVRLALAEGMLTLAGQPEVLIFSLWWLPVWALGASLRLPITRTGLIRVAQALVGVGLGVALGACLAAWQLLPTLALLGMSNRAEGMAWDFLTGASLPPWHVLGVLAPNAFGDPRGGGPGQYWPGPDYEWHERLLYVGIVPLVAAARVTGRWRWVCAGAGLLALGLAFGRYSPWYAWAQVLPGYASFRIPSKHLTLVALAICLAGGAGLQRVRGRRVAVTALVGAGVVAVAGLTLPAWLPPAAGLVGGSELVTPDLPRAGGTLAAAVALAVIGGAALLPGAWAPRTLLVLGVLDVVVVLAPFRIGGHDPHPVYAALDGVSDYSRLAVAADDAPLIANLAPLVHITQPSGYTSLFSAGYSQLVTGGSSPGVVLNAAETDPLVLLLLGYPAELNPAAGVLTVFSPPPPRVWVARCARAGDAITARAPGFPLQSCVTVASVSAGDETAAVPAGHAQITLEKAGWLDVDADGPGWLVTDQPWYPGWTAQVDGAGQSVDVLDGALVGVRLAAGSHSVRLRYSVPAGLWPGVALAVLAVLVLGGLWRWGSDQRWRRLLTSAGGTGSRP